MLHDFLTGTAEVCLTLLILNPPVIPSAERIASIAAVITAIISPSSSCCTAGFAAETGFFDSSHFIHAYKKWKGLTPKQQKLQYINIEDNRRDI